MKYFNWLLERFKKTPDSALDNLSKKKEDIKLDVASVLKEGSTTKDGVDNTESKNIEINKTKKSHKTSAKKRIEHKYNEYDEIDEEDIGTEDDYVKDYEYYYNYNYDKSLLNEILLDPVLRYALENWKWKFLHSMKYWKTDEYETIKEEMIKNWWENFNFEWSLLQKISENYVYFRALEKLDTKLLDKLRNGTILYNDYKKFADNNNIDVIVWSLGFTKYHEWISKKNLH